MMLTIDQLLHQAIPRLAAAGVESARLDAEVLLAHVLGVRRGWVWAHRDAVVTPAQAEAFAALLARREGREPLAHLLGVWEFYGRDFAVSADVLIPRPETELLVEAVAQWAQARGARRLADIGTGSGVIAVTLALELPAVTVYAVDLSPAALAVARGNAARHGVGECVLFREGDLLDPLRKEAPLDAVVANLPYIAEEEMAGLMPEVRDFEPALALRAGEGGLALIYRLIAQAPSRLAPGGLLALEVGYDQAAQVAAHLAEGGWQAVRVIDDYAGIPRHVLAERA